MVSAGAPGWIGKGYGMATARTHAVCAFGARIQLDPRITLGQIDAELQDLQTLDHQHGHERGSVTVTGQESDQRLILHGPSVSSKIPGQTRIGQPIDVDRAAVGTQQGAIILLLMRPSRVPDGPPALPSP